MKRKLLSILALLCLTASSAWAGVIESDTNGNITWSLDDDGVLSISGSGVMPKGLFPYSWSNGTKVKKIIFADDCAITKLSTDMFVCYVNDSQLTDVEIKTTVPLAISEKVFFYSQGGAVNFTITAPSITYVGIHPFVNYDSPRYIVFNVPEPIPFEKGSFDNLKAFDTVTIPAGCKIRTGRYVFNDPDIQDYYEEMVQKDDEASFWEDADDYNLIEGIDYEYSTESTEDLTCENASQVFGSATVIFPSYNLTADEETGNLSGLNDYKGKTCTVTYARSFTADKPSTLCLPFAFPTSSANGKFYTFSDITKEGTEYIADMTEYTGTNLVANVPYLYKANATGEVDFGGTYEIPNSLTAGSTESNGWTFKGTYETISWTEAPTGIYGFSAQNVDEQGISQGQFVKVGEYVRIRPMRCYLENESFAGARGMNRAAADEPLPETIKVRLISANGDVMGIGSLQTKTGEVTMDNEAWYSIDGRRIEGKPSTKGIYVNNGKKVIINK